MPIAIVGMSCRLSGKVSSLDDFWEMLTRARCGWSEIPESRFSKDAFYHPNPAKQGAFNTYGGYFLDQDPALFDAAFFNITQAEAEAMAADPQQRLLLETSYEAIENAGIPREKLIGQNVGVFIGGNTSDYRLGNLRDIQQTPMFDITGNHQALLAGRISHYFDFRGPSFSVDTACSSSLYALHQAVQSIRAGESEQALVAACHWNLQPDDWVSMSLSRLFNEEGKTYAFDHRAQAGFARGEGSVAILLKPLDQAIRDNDKIRSVIVNTGANQDGRTVGITSPSGKAQEALMRDVYAKAGIDPVDVGFVEAHGTGTKVGDPIEATAIYNVFGKDRTAKQPLYIGSAKSNVGHTENVSGLVSVVKAAMMLEKGFILPNTNFESPNPGIPFDKWNLKVATAQRPWPIKKRYISINNFGFGGSNAHCVLQRGPFISKTGQPNPEHKVSAPRLFVLSANDETAAKKSMEQLSIFLEQHPEIFQRALLRNLAYTLSDRRSHMPWRIGMVAHTSAELGEILASGDAKPARCSQPPKIAFVYTGQGAQWYAMGRELLGTYPVFDNAIRAADACLKRLGADFSLYEELLKDKATSEVNKAYISQPICSAIQLGLTDLLKSWDITPSAVTGHSSGEICAAYAAGALSFDAVMAIAYFRGQTVIKMKEMYPDLKGSMMAVGAGPDEMIPLAKQLKTAVAVVACENSPSSVTISGDEAAIDELAAQVEEKQMFNRKLAVDVAYHSPHMKLGADIYHDSIKDTQPISGGDVAFYSSLHGKKVDHSVLDASYWVDNLTCPVRFSTSLKELCLGSSPDVVIELGPHAALEGPIKQTLKTLGQQATKIAYFSALVRNTDANVTALKLAANLWVKGLPLDMAKVNRESGEGEPPTLISDMIPYPWSRQKYWIEPLIAKQHRNKPFPRHDLLGLLADFSNELAPTWRNVLRTDDLPWLRDHKMQSLTTFPFAGFVSMATEAAAQRASMRGVEFERFSMREIHVKRPLLMEDGVGYEVVLSMAPYAEGTRSYSDNWDEFRIWSWEEGKGWTEHCRGMVAVRKGNGSNGVSSAHQKIAASRFRAADQLSDEEVRPEPYYNELNEKGATYGPLFQRLSSIRAGNNHVIARATVPNTAAGMPMEHETRSYVSAPLLDQLIQLPFVILGAGRFGMSTLFMPSSIGELNFHRDLPRIPGEAIHVTAYGRPDFSTPRATDFTVDAMRSLGDQEAIISIENMQMSPVKGELAVGDAPRSLCYKLKWELADKTEDEEAQSANVSETLEPNNLDRRDSGYASGVNGTGARVEAVHPAWPSKNVALITAGPTEGLTTSLIETLRGRTGKMLNIYSLENAPASENVYNIFCELDTPILSDLTPERFGHVQKLLTSSAGVLWVTRGAYLNATNPTGSMAMGLTRTVRSEMEAKAATLDLDPESKLSESAKLELILQAFEKVFLDEQATDMEYSEKGGRLVVPRIVDDEEMNVFVQREICDSAPYLQDFVQDSRRLKMEIGTLGALDTLFFQDDKLTPLGDQEIEIQVQATGMNFKDVVIAMGQVPSPYIGIECAGVVSRVGKGVATHSVGDRVCAMTEGAYSTFARCPATSAARMPSAMPFDVAASIPVVYCTAYYGLVELGKLAKGERILIHAAAGGVGQAAIQLAQVIGAEIFATVGNAEKKQLIMERYGIPEDRIFSSRDTSFGPAIREATKGQGVDVVINSLAGEILRETWDCIAHFGRFIEIGKRDITSNSRLEMSKFNFNATFSSVDLTVYATERPQLMAQTFKEVMKLFSVGSLEPIAPITVFGISEVETAFRLLQSGKTVGKLVVVPQPGEQVKATHTKATSDLLRSDATYIIIGGTGGLGRSMSKWMVGKGARNIVLLSRSGRMDGPVAELARDLKRSAGANIIVESCDVTDKESVVRMVDFCTQNLPPLAGLVHSSMVLRDILFEKMTFEDYQDVICSKVAGAWNVHDALLQFNVQLDFFIAISSVAGIIGNRGQAAYAAANTFLDAFAQYRMRLGLPTAAIDLTAVADVGYLADNAERQEEVLKSLSAETINEAEVLALIQAAIQGSMRQACNNHCLTGLKLGGEGVTADQLPYYATDARFTQLRDAALAMSSTQGSSAQVSIGAALANAKSPDEAVEIVTGGVANKLGAILMVAVEDLDPQTPITKYGLDSLNAIELRNWITKELGANLQVLELLTSGSLTNLSSIILKKRSAAAEAKA
ncbi:polyketide synthase [Thozetella sp. PMI_491]|nr:polyketide synthase [Thozetella sp. PMI_491]